MLTSNVAASPPGSIPTTPAKSSDALDNKQRHYHVSVSLEGLTERKLRDLALQENASESSIVEAALRGFFDSGRVQNLHATLAQLSIAPRSRNV